ncbi:MAG: CTP-dependent riboflavin kinase [Candidatus Thalassarchaeum sp.]|jgi:CTP-dependent riboflavin kinase|nr:CTP-dependent riboflavin kinase [Candidatus Thalassarchaeum sp.]MDA7555917.1 CTP-dependent riboflavin kinase [Euryarchaeota archaeon]MDB3855246.1 CTP-dependent riboflavin kinase [Euryarchaeota archaeon]MDC0962620.1 CTP-dependent riboflavin kinase [Euryarchaeota archaeon]|tara:strand:+ start:593 stop:1027 length:435 start_codon:yes stop_codon:yes gene_type:complete
MHLSGKVSSGLGRAHVFMAQPHYQEQFKQVLDVSAWPGTLNLDMDESSLSDYKNLRILSGLEEGDISHHTNSFRIKGFERDGKSFGGATAFLAKISVDNENWIECAILIPDLTRHTETAEVISGSFLRESLPCKDGDKLKIKLN